MAKNSNGANPVVPNFKTIDKEAASRAQAALSGGNQEPLKVSKNAKVSVDKNGAQYSRWTEPATIVQAYRSVSKKGLLDVVVVAKIRQSEANTGRRVFGHFYLNLGPDVSEGHQMMNDRSNGAIMSLASATGFLPKKGELTGSMLDKLFPSKGQPGAESPLNNKSVVLNVVQTLGPQKNQKTGKPILDDDGEPIMEKRDSIESFLVSAAPAVDEDEADEDEDEDDEDEVDEDEDEEEEDDEFERSPAPPKSKRGK